MKTFFSFYIFVAVGLLSNAAARPPILSTKLKNGTEKTRLGLNNVIDPKLARNLLDNDFEEGSTNPWYDESPAYVNWRVESFTSPSEVNSTAPRPSTGTNYLRATRNADLASGLAVLRSPVFSANPGDRVSFDFWIRSKRPEGNNLELVWVVDRTEYLLAGLSQYSTLANYEWRKEYVTIPVDAPIDGYMIFYGYCGSNLEDAIAIDNIAVESSSFTTPEPGKNCILLSASIGTFTSPNYPANYPNDANICWLITGAYSINLDFTSFATETGRDSLKIYLGDTTSSELYADLSGANYPGSISQYTESMLIVFTSDSTNTYKGFSINYQVTKATTTTTTTTTPTSTTAPSTPRTATTTSYYWTYSNPSTNNWSPSPSPYDCGDFFYQYTLPLTIQSFNFPNDYANNLDCRYTIQVPLNRRARFTLTSFSTESGWDYLTVYDGPSTSYPILLSASGSSLPPVVNASVDTILVRFTTDGSGTYKGWEAVITNF